MLPLSKQFIVNHRIGLNEFVKNVVGISSYAKRNVTSINLVQHFILQESIYPSMV